MREFFHTLISRPMLEFYAMLGGEALIFILILFLITRDRKPKGNV